MVPRSGSTSTGLDGQGQSDFVRCIAGVQAPVSGRITIVRDGIADDIDGLASARGNKVSYVSGDRKKEGIFANLSIFENLLMPVYREYRAGGALAFVNTTKLSPVFEWESGKLAVKMGSRGDPIVSLSGGNQQKVLIARAFAEKPLVLVLNDPARGIDVGAKLDLYRNLRDFAARGNAVVFLSSEIEEFLDLCTRVHVFRNGAISRSFDPPYDGHVLLNAMFGRRADAALPGEAANDDEAGHHHGFRGRSTAATRFEGGRPMPRPLRPPSPGPVSGRPGPAGEAAFVLSSPDIVPGQVIPVRFVEDSKVSPR